MRVLLGALLLLLAAATAQAGEADYRAARIDIGEGKIRSSYECELMPTPADIADIARAALDAQKKSLGLSQEFRLFPKTATIDPKSLKVVFDFEVPYVLYDASDGPRSKTIILGEKIWSGGAPDFAGEPKMIYYEVDVGCGQDLIDALHSVIKDQASRLALRFKTR